MQASDQLVFGAPYLDPQCYDFLETHIFCRSWDSLSNELLVITLADLWVVLLTLRKSNGHPHFSPFLGRGESLGLHISAPKPTIFFKLCQNLVWSHSFPTRPPTIPARCCEWHFWLSAKKVSFCRGATRRGGPIAPNRKTSRGNAKKIIFPKFQIDISIGFWDIRRTYKKKNIPKQELNGFTLSNTLPSGGGTQCETWNVNVNVKINVNVNTNVLHIDQFTITTNYWLKWVFGAQYLGSPCYKCFENLTEFSLKL